MTVGERRATIAATAVPHDPAPITATFGCRRSTTVTGRGDLQRIDASFVEFVTGAALPQRGSRHWASRFRPAHPRRVAGRVVRQHRTTTPPSRDPSRTATKGLRSAQESAWSSGWGGQMSQELSTGPGEPAQTEPPQEPPRISKAQMNIIFVT